MPSFSPIGHPEGLFSVQLFIWRVSIQSGWSYGGTPFSPIVHLEGLRSVRLSVQLFIRRDSFQSSCSYGGTPFSQSGRAKLSVNKTVTRVDLVKKPVNV
jgi:hypothetical protein